MVTASGASGAGDAALRLAGGNALAGLLLLVRGEGRLAAEFDALKWTPSVGPLVPVC